VDFANQQVKAVMGKPLPVIDAQTEVSEAYRILLSGSNAVIVSENNVPKSVLTRIDLIDFFIRNKQ
jgi:cystathionine beta-synthase